MQIPGKEEEKAHFDAFLEATSTEALSQKVCLARARELWAWEGECDHVRL